MYLAAKDFQSSFDTFMRKMIVIKLNAGWDTLLFVTCFFFCLSFKKWKHLKLNHIWVAETLWQTETIRNLIEGLLQVFCIKKSNLILILNKMVNCLHYFLNLRNIKTSKWYRLANRSSNCHTNWTALICKWFRKLDINSDNKMEKKNLQPAHRDEAGIFLRDSEISCRFMAYKAPHKFCYCWNIHLIFIATRAVNN